MKHIYIIILISLFCHFPAFAEEGNLSLDRCQQMAKENYPLIRQYELIDKTVEYSLSNVKKAYLPQFNLSAQATYQSAAADFPDELKRLFASVVDIEGMKRDQYKVALEVNQTIWDGGNVSAKSAELKAQKEVSQRNIDVELYTLKQRVNNLYFGILLLNESIRQNKLTQHLLEQNRMKLNSMQENGVAQQSDIDALTVQLLTVRQQYKNFDIMQQSYMKMLSLLIGQEITDISRLKRPMDIEHFPNQNNRPELALYNAQLSHINAQERSVKSGLMPKIGLFATGFYGYPGFNMMEDMFNPAFSWNYLVGIKMQWNIGSFYTRKNSLKQLSTQREQIENKRELFLFNLEQSTTQQQHEIMRLKQLIADDSEIVRLRNSIRIAEESKLANGIIDVTELLQKITDEQNASLAKAAHEIELLKYEYELKTTTNN